MRGNETFQFKRVVRNSGERVEPVGALGNLISCGEGPKIGLNSGPMWSLNDEDSVC